MKNLLDFLIKYSSWLLFIIYAAIGSVMLFSSNPYQHHVYLTSANRVSSAVYDVVSNVTGYFDLREINRDLQRRNAALELEALALRQKLRAEAIRGGSIDTIVADSIMSRYSFILAGVINNSTVRPNNYITIDKGALDGVKPEMGVVDQNGVVGIVNVTGPHTARLISLLNPHMRLSCKVKGSQHVGSLQWDGRDAGEAVLDELPRHARFRRGDTIVTSGFSTAFPEGIPVGTVMSSQRDRDNNFLAVRIKLFTDFTTLSTVRVVRDAMTQELRSLEERDIDEATSTTVIR